MQLKGSLICYIQSNLQVSYLSRYLFQITPADHSRGGNQNNVLWYNILPKYIVHTRECILMISSHLRKKMKCSQGQFQQAEF